MIEKVKGLSICGRCFSKKTNLAFFPNDNDRIAIVYGKNGSGKSTISDGFSQIASGEDTEELSASGIKPNTIRLSIGLENINDILRDLAQALA